MAAITPEVIDALRKTAGAIKANPAYQWGHMGLCNCGFLAQQVTQLRKDEIHFRAMQRHGNWSEQLNDYCPTSGLPIDELISEMLAFGFDADDLKHLERLSDPLVRRHLPEENRNLLYNVKEDVVIYLETWGKLLEEELLKQVHLPQLKPLAVPA